mmetsp:Transcript_19492/g.27455  ORF Transcript_19492/g.27455 Transcript_19492/m.27455 type:complete len:294 (-) Transcript_19492:182-1063(-)
MAPITPHATRFVGNKQEIEKRPPLQIDNTQNRGSPPSFLSPQSKSLPRHKIDSGVSSTSNSHHETYFLPTISPRQQEVNRAIPLPPDTVNTATVPPPPPARRLVQLNMKLIEECSMDSADKNGIGAQAQNQPRSKEFREKLKFKENDHLDSNSSSSSTNVRSTSPVSLVRELSKSFSIAKNSSMVKTKNNLVRKKKVGIGNISIKREQSDGKEADASAAKFSFKEESKTPSTAVIGNRRRISTTRKASKIEALKHKFSGTGAMPKTNREDNTHEESNRKKVGRKKWPPVKTKT